MRSSSILLLSSIHLIFHFRTPSPLRLPWRWQVGETTFSGGQRDVVGMTANPTYVPYTTPAFSGG